MSPSERDLRAAERALRRHLESWEYAFAMGGGCHSGAEHPFHWATRERTRRLEARVAELRGRQAER